MPLQSLVYEDHYKTCCSIHEERCHSYRNNILYNSCFEFVDSSFKMNYKFFVGEYLCNPHQCNGLCNDCCNCSPLYSPVQNIYENWIKHCINYNSIDGSHHCLFGKPGRTHYCVQTQIHMSNYISNENNCHIIPCISYCIFTGPEEI